MKVVDIKTYVVGNRPPYSGGVCWTNVHTPGHWAPPMTDEYYLVNWLFMASAFLVVYPEVEDSGLYATPFAGLEEGLRRRLL